MEQAQLKITVICPDQNIEVLVMAFNILSTIIKSDVYLFVYNYIYIYIYICIYICIYINIFFSCHAQLGNKRNHLCATLTGEFVAHFTCASSVLIPSGLRIPIKQLQGFLLD